MREIKFRAWIKPSYKSKGKGQMVDWDTIWSTWDVADLFGKVGTIPLEWTGLQDKNGKEIYEGDILDFGDYSIAKYGRCLHIVYWNDEDAGFNSREVGFQKLAGFGIDETGAVIGNIYENEELLNG
ncbi:hypothetical protein LCGC14_0350040 [marine sediment metagenome]|uniref:YopX protein domain-containing protein n=1 Tax=marine sediment metagenome TaxID=412755 RepID=A0A0F9TU35_9ZZZZ